MKDCKELRCPFWRYKNPAGIPIIGGECSVHPEECPRRKNHIDQVLVMTTLKLRVARIKMETQNVEQFLSSIIQTLEQDGK